MTATDRPSAAPADVKASATAPAGNTLDIATVLFRVAWMSIALGILMEFVLVGLDWWLAGNLEARNYLADSVQKVSWSFFVCVGLAVGTAASSARPVWMGLAGLFSAPLAFTIARSLHKFAVQALGMSTPAAGGAPTPEVLAILKALEYAFLGLTLAGLAKKGTASIRNHLLTGLAAGILFGGTIVVWKAAAGAARIALIPLTANELIFPIGCSLVLFASRALGRRAAFVSV
jgi:hypothetical protein